MIHFVFFDHNSSLEPSVQEIIYRSIEALWISTRFHVLIELFFPRKDNLRSVQIYRLNDGYHMEIVRSKMADKGKDQFELYVRNEMTLEENFAKVDEIMEKLSDDALPLEESFGIYKEGMEVLSNCQKVIDEVEKKVKELSE